MIRGFNSDAFFGVALTGREKSGKYYVPLGDVGGRPASVILSQVRLIDSRRLIRRIAVLDENMFEKVCVSLQEVLFGRNK